MTRLLLPLALLVCSCFRPSAIRARHQEEAVTNAYSAQNFCKAKEVQVQPVEGIAGTWLARGCGKEVQMCHDTGEWTCGPNTQNFKWED